jgi:phytoene/squalene synthetase
MQELPTDEDHCVGRWYLPTMNTQTWSPAKILAGTFQEHFMKLVLPMSFETDYRREVVC